MDNTELRKAIRRTLMENYEDLGMWSDFDRDEMMGDAQKAAMKDIEDSGEEFQTLGKNKFEKNLDIEDMIADLDRQKLGLKNDEKEQNNLQKAIDKKKKHEKMFGAGSMNETSKIDRPKDAEGQPMTLNARVEDLETKNIGRIVRFEMDNDGKLTVNVAWTGNFGGNIPKSITYPDKIVVRDNNRIVREVELTDEGIGTGLSMKKGMNIKPAYGK